VGAAGASAWLVLAGHTTAAGAAAAGAGLLLLLGSSLAGTEPRPLLRFVDLGADRAFDGLVLSALAWASHDSAPTASGLALAVLAVSFVGAYVRARGQALGYPVGDSLLNRGLRYGLVSVGLLAGWLEATLWPLAGLVLLTTVIRASQVAKLERA
jgi:phosphatidylglycerophosphate synthase